jgi:hypothetical protein
MALSLAMHALFQENLQAIMLAVLFFFGIRQIEIVYTLYYQDLTIFNSKLLLR